MYLAAWSALPPWLARNRACAYSRRPVPPKRSRYPGATWLLVYKSRMRGPSFLDPLASWQLQDAHSERHLYQIEQQLPSPDATRGRPRLSAECCNKQAPVRKGNLCGCQSLTLVVV